jgi:hypothetical protein
MNTATEQTTVQNPDLVKLFMKDLLHHCTQENTTAYWKSIEKLIGYVSTRCPDFERQIDTLLVKQQHTEFVYIDHDATVEEAKEALRTIITNGPALTCKHKERLMKLSEEMPELESVLMEFACQN